MINTFQILNIVIYFSDRATFCSYVLFFIVFSYCQTQRIHVAVFRRITTRVVRFFFVFEEYDTLLCGFKENETSFVFCANVDIF